MIICEHCCEEMEPVLDVQTGGGYYGDTHATYELCDSVCPECGSDTHGIYVESESLRRYYRRFGFPGEEILKHVEMYRL